MEGGSMSLDDKGNLGMVSILVATDLHVGYMERDPIRCNDSVNSLEEVLQIATNNRVDMVLCGGDLFHENRPTREMQYKVTQLLRKYCLANRPVNLQFLSDASINFNHSMFARVNYEDPNLNVGLPFFTIHGNHDDLAGKGLSALDLLHEAGLVNLFGKFSQIESFEVTPILLKKGDVRLAIYGISSQRDDRLHNAFKAEKIRFLRPSGDAESWFSILVLHQNRSKRSEIRSTGAFLPESVIPSFFDLVIWGHEHECRIKPGEDPQLFVVDKVTEEGFHIIQPGSSIATSLSQEEAVKKHITLLKIRPNRHFKSNAIPLNSVRPFLFDELTIDRHTAGRPFRNKRPTDARDEQVLADRVEELLEKAAQMKSDGRPIEPLIRIRATYADEWASAEFFNVPRFGQQFLDRVANPRDIVIFKRQRHSDKDTKGRVDIAALDDAQRRRMDREQLKSTVEDIIRDYFRTVEGKESQLSVLGENELGKAVNEFVVKDSNEFEARVQTQLNMMRTHIKSTFFPKDDSAVQFDDTGEPMLTDSEMPDIGSALDTFRERRMERVRAQQRQLEDEAMPNAGATASYAANNANWAPAATNSTNMEEDEGDDDDDD